ncbi:sigma 54-interacting transcriptional regulator [Myxococcota bacterium]|nr:sigma 54-interacting transcriptional regulator [Myxococcota bacterium]
MARSSGASTTFHGHEGARWLVVRGQSTAVRVALPALGTFTIGRSGTDVAIDEPGVAERHLVVRLTPSIEVDVLDADTGIVRVDARKRTRTEEPLAVGASIRLSLGDELRAGSVALALLAEAPHAPGPRAWSRTWLEGQVASEAGPSSLLVRWRATGLEPGALERFFVEHLEPRERLAELGDGELVTFLPEQGALRARALGDALLARLGSRDVVVELGTCAATGAPVRDLVDRTGVQMARLVAGQGDDGLVAESGVMRDVLALVDRVAEGTTPVLILGETGAGKDAVAERLHGRSGRAPLVRLGGAELEAALVEGDGAAVFARASGGTVLVDEVGGLSPRAQLALGRVVERSDVRFVATSNHDLKADVRRGTFRKDLFFRLNRVTIELPPLRARVDDIVPLAELFVRQLAPSARRTRAPRLSEGAKAALVAHRWPGNVRELKNVIERALFVAPSDVIGAEHLVLDVLGDDEATLPPDERPKSAEPRRADAPRAEAPRAEAPREGEARAQVSLRDEMAALERRRITEALEAYPTQAEAAKALDIPLRTFLNRLDALGIARPRKG